MRLDKNDRNPHDQFAKQYLQELLSLLGEVETSRDVASEARQVVFCLSRQKMP